MDYEDKYGAIEKSMDSTPVFYYYVLPTDFPTAPKKQLHLSSKSTATATKVQEEEQQQQQEYHHLHFYSQVVVAAE